MKVFNDPVHGHIQLDPICIQVIDTPQFQRLRNLKQMGSAYHVFPGAAHNRFEHSIGVCHLASRLIDHLQKTQPELGISSSDVKCVQLAGLCHDLGHGPFSHVFDNEFIKQARPGLEWTHEKASEDMLDFLLQQSDIDVTAEELACVKDLIHGAPRSVDYPQASKGYLFDIVANRRNSIDVDKFDYIIRDCHNVGIKCSVDAGRLITFSRVVDNQICYHQKDAFNLYELFHIRYSLFKRIYTHKVGKAVEYMITDALLAADSVLKISSAVDDMQRYMFLDDSIVNEIERSTDPALEESRLILSRIRHRDLYRCADQIHLPVDLYDAISADQITPADIVQHASNTSTPDQVLEEKDIVVEWLTLNLALKDRNPLDSVRFYSKYDPKNSIAIPKEHISSFIPNHFKEVIIRVFVRDASKAGQAQEAFRGFLKSINEQRALQSERDPRVDEEDEVTQTEEVQPVIENPIRSSPSSIPKVSPVRDPSLCFFSPRQKTLPSNSTPIIDRSHMNPFLVDKVPSSGSPSLPKSVRSSRNVSPSKSILEPSDALTLPKNFHEIMADSPARKRKR